MMGYAARLIMLVAEYGKHVLWADSHWGRNIWIDVGLNKNLADTIRAYRRYFIPVWKMNGALTPYSAHDAVFGLWTSGAVDNWGVQPERWYWYEAGLKMLGQQGWFKEGEMADMPASFYGQMILLGLSGGASVYSLEPGEDTFTSDGGLSEISRRITFPLFSEMILQAWIPGRDIVRAKVRSVYVAGSADSPWSLDYGTLRPIYEATYGVLNPFQMIPSTGRYFWLPVVSKWMPGTPVQPLRAGMFATSAQARAYFDRQYPGGADSGEAWLVRSGDLALVMNSFENVDRDQRFEVDLGGAIRKITGQVAVNSYLIAQHRAGELRLQLNGRPDRAQSLDLWAAEKPGQITVVPPAALAASSWDAARSRLALKILLNEGAVNVRIQ